MNMRIFRCVSRASLSMLALVAMLLLSACSDKEAEQRKAFIDYLQNTTLRSGTQLPRLSEDQKKQFGAYISDYAILYRFSTEMNNVIDQGIRPAISALNTIHIPQDYMTQRNTIRQSAENLAVITQQIQNAKIQADTAKAALKQPDELNRVYNTVYQHVVTLPASKLSPVLPVLQSLCQDIVQTGSFLQQQGAKVTFDAEKGVQFPTQQQTKEYNMLMNSMATKSQALNQAMLFFQKN
ncbi:DUF3053 domain-containing protein [Enterobacteriaceae bacterium LUAb1]